MINSQNRGLSLQFLFSKILGVLAASKDRNRRVHCFGHNIEINIGAHDLAQLRSKTASMYVSPIKRKKLFLGDVFPLNKVLSLVSTTKYMKFECRIGIWRCDWRSISLFMSYISNSARCKYVWMDTACWNNLPLCISKLAPIKLQVPVNYLFPYELSFNYVTFILKKSIKYFWPKLHTFFVMSVRILPWPGKESSAFL